MQAYEEVTARKNKFKSAENKEGGMEEKSTEWNDLRNKDRRIKDI